MRKLSSKEEQLINFSLTVFYFQLFAPAHKYLNTELALLILDLKKINNRICNINLQYSNGNLSIEMFDKKMLPIRKKLKDIFENLNPIKYKIGEDCRGQGLKILFPNGATGKITNDFSGEYWILDF